MEDFILNDQILVETPITALYTNTTNHFDTPRDADSNRVQIKKVAYVAMPQSGAFGVGATTGSDVDDYETKILFENVIYKTEEDDNPSDIGFFTFQTNDGQDYLVKRLDHTHDAKVRCTCLDFYFRFAVWHNRDGSLFGDPPPPYENKTKGRKPVNPERIAGLCKHIMALVNKLKQENLFQ